MRLKTVLLGAACASALVPAVAAAQASMMGEVIVTARKRQESILNVPVVETAIPQAAIERFQTIDMKDVATKVPGLRFGDQVLTIGTQVSLRGVGTTTLDAGVDQSVSLNLDGLQLSNGLAYETGMFDVGQIEVLKGPQALFYGKNSPGGVISLRTADPTDKFEVIARAGHEFEAMENRAELIVSGPVNDQLRMRLAVLYDHQEGYFFNDAVPLIGTGAKAPATNRDFPQKEYIIRGTIIWRPNNQFDARIKLNASHNRIEGGPMGQLTSCPDGVGPVPGFNIPFEGGGEDCKLDRTLRVVDNDPAAFPGIRNGGTPFTDIDQKFGTVELNYRPRPDITLTSTTGYYKNGTDGMINGTQTNFAGTPLTADNHFTRREVTEEVRANSDFSGPLNFTAGAFFQDGEVHNRIIVAGNTALRLPPILTAGFHNLDIRSYSTFGQLRWKIIPKVELALGARYTKEKRSDSPTNLAGVPTLIPNPKIESDDFSPELTLTYKPTDNITAFGSLKKGFKAGSFSITTPATTGVDNSFGPEKVKGGEAGLKTRWLDRRLAIDLAAYSYRYLGLQVGANETAQGGIPVLRTVNAGSALVYGVDLDVNYHPEMFDGLELHGSMEYNHARFKTLNNVPCYGGQLVSEGCNQVLNPATGAFTSQDLSGAPFVRAPDWSANLGFSWDVPIGNDMRVTVANDNQYSSRYLTDLGVRPDYYQPKYLKTDLSLTLHGPKDRWEVSFIGKNLGDKLTAGTCTNLNHANGQVLGGLNTGGTVRGPAGQDELICFVDRGRELWLRLTLRPFN